MAQPLPLQTSSLPIHPLRKSLAIGTIGNVLEMYDFSLYAYFSPIIAQLFFPSGNPSVSLISTFGIFAAGFLMRPFGAIFFGFLGDRLGRKNALFLSILLISLPTCAMGLLPTYQEIGIMAPFLLTILRLIQGLSAGGEYTSSIVYLIENAPPHRRGFAGSFALFGSGIGWLLGSFSGGIANSVLSQENLLAWGWRIPFLCGIITLFYGLYVRKDAAETESFLKLKIENNLSQNPIKEIFAQQKGNISRIIGLNMLSTIAGFLLYAYMPTYLHKVVGLPFSDALFINVLGLAFFNLLVPFAGLLSDRIGNRFLFYFGATGFVILSYPLFLMLQQGTFSSCVFAMGIFTVMIAAYHGPLPAAMAEFFPPSVRSSALGIAYNCAVSIFSGTCPLVASLLIEITGDALSPAYYLMAGGLITLCVIPTFLNSAYLKGRDIAFCS